VGKFAADPVIVLVVDDNPGDVNLIREAFKRNKLLNIIEVVNEGEKAIEYLKKTGPYNNAIRPDLILLDLNMPGKDGREVLSEIKSDPDFQAIPVIVLTSSTSDEDIVKAYFLHANCYIKKPDDFDGLFEVIKSIEYFWLGIVKLP
jgi:CheY-like chemotaxis protein